ncbi:MAG TPA: heme biosynthesis protein HemY [Burkholderiales bacterium]|nr:heme biosynthesis protein HemY [Burkholderiales bacterium]
MRGLIWLVGLFAVAVTVVLTARMSDGYVLLVLPPHRIELSLNVAILTVLATAVAAYIAVRALALILSMPGRVRAFHQRRAQKKARAAFAGALRNYFEGRFGKAQRSAEIAMQMGESPGLSAVLAARAAHGMRAYSARDDYLARSAEVAPEDAGVRLMAQAEMLLDERRYHDTLEVLRQLPEKHTAALRLELRAQQLARNWDQVLALLPLLEKRKVFESPVVAQLRRQAVIENLKRKALDAASLREFWNKLSAELKREPRIAATAAQSFAALGDCAEPTRIIESALAAQWDPGLLALYAECLGPNVMEQLQRAESWLQLHPRDPVLLLVLGRLCAHQELWGKARSYLDASLSIEPTHTAHIEIARLLERTGKPESAAEQYREALDLTLAQLKQLAGGRRRPAL